MGKSLTIQFKDGTRITINGVEDFSVDPDNRLNVLKNQHLSVFDFGTIMFVGYTDDLFDDLESEEK